MKKIAVFAMLFVAMMATAQENQVVEFNERTHDFGTVKQEDGDIYMTFTFVNQFASPITLKSVKASCGCTTPEWSHEPIAPNATGTIRVKYAAATRPGSFTKSITVVLTNGSEDFTEMLYIKGNVQPKPAEPAPAQ